MKKEKKSNLTFQSKENCIHNPYYKLYLQSILYIIYTLHTPLGLAKTKMINDIQSDSGINW